MRFSNSFEVPLPPDRAWPLLLDIRRIAPCMPGAELTEVVDDRTFRGRVAVRLGPVNLSFAGTARFEAIDASARTARVKAQGSDVKGRGGASAVVNFAVQPAEGGTRVMVDTDLDLSGSVAQYGRASGMIQSVAAQLIAQFAASLRGEIARAFSGEADTASPSDRRLHDRGIASGGEPASGDVARTADATKSGAHAPPSGAAAPQAKPISGLSLIARALWDMLRGWFRRSPSRQ